MRNPNRIVHVVQSLQVGGLERMVARVALEQRRRGDRPAVLAYDSDGAVGEELRSAGIEVIAWKGASGVRPKLVPALAAAFKKLGANIVHTHHVGPLLYGGLAARLSGASLVHTEHSLEQLDTNRRRFAARLVANRARLVAVADAVARGAQGAYGRALEVIVNGVPVPPVAPPRPGRTTGRTLRAVTAVRLSPEKGVDVLLAALARRDAARWHLDVLGTGPEAATLALRTKQLGLGSRVTFHGAVQDIRPWLRKADAAVLASRREGLPLFVLEAMAEGVPVLSTDVGGVAEALGPAGFVTRPEDPASLAGALQAVAAALDNGAGPSLGHRLHARASQLFSLTHMVDRYDEVYESARGRVARAA